MEDSRGLITVEEQKQQELLNNGVVTADRFINKNYLINLSRQDVVPIAEHLKVEGKIRFFQIEKLVFDKEENTNDKLISVYSALQDIDSAVLMLIIGNEKDVTYYIGVRSKENAATASNILKKGLVGNFPGSEFRILKNSEISKVMESVIASDYVNMPKNITSVTVVPSPRDEDKEKFVQGMEKFMDAMQGSTYSALFIANPVTKKKLELQKRGYEELYSSLSPFIKTTLAYGENYSKAVTKGMFENFSHSINNSVANTTGGNESYNRSITEGSNRGMSAGGMSFGRSNSETVGYSQGQSWSKSVTEGTADTSGMGTSDSDTITDGNSRTLTIEHQNKSIATLLDTIDAQLERIKACEAFGIWECAGYFISDDIQTSVVAANTYKALMIGDETHVENAFINTWGIQVPENAQNVLEYMRYGEHPIISIAPENGFELQFVTPRKSH